MAGRKPLYRDLMTWRAINNALAGLLAGVAGGVLLGALIADLGRDPVHPGDRHG